MADTLATPFGFNRQYLGFFHYCLRFVHSCLKLVFNENKDLAPTPIRRENYYSGFFTSTLKSLAQWDQQGVMLAVDRTFPYSKYALPLLPRACMQVELRIICRSTVSLTSVRARSQSLTKERVNYVKFPD